jgi:NADPH:quinone reductase-like Zn-dependent oxidoreductase
MPLACRKMPRPAIRKLKVTRVFAQPDPSKVREFLDDIRNGRFILPIGRRLPLKDASEGHRLGEKGGIGKILLIA